MENSTQHNRDRTSVDVALLVLRLFLGVIFAIHGAQKFGAFDGPGIEAVVKGMGPVGYLVTIGELFGGLGLIVGFLSRFSSAALTVIMIGAIQKVHFANGFFMPGGYEYNLALIGMSLTILIAGPGRYAFTNVLPQKVQKFLS
ncbi:MAG: DoxX family protein [Fimbriimonadaceae bacterium]|nr:DoxX family protein [Fimbriimonadaceae bacterium]